MSGTSSKEKASNEQYNTLKGFAGDIGGGKYSVANRFDTYTDPFGYEDISTQLDDIFGGYESKIKRDTNETMANQQQGAAARMASRGITGGSAVDDTMSGIATDINKSKTNALSELGIGKATSIADLMKYINQQNYNTTQAATNVDLSNQSNVLGGLGNAYGLQQGAISGLDDTTWLDDILGGVKTAANSSSGINEFIKMLGGD